QMAIAQPPSSCGIKVTVKPLIHTGDGTYSFDGVFPIIPNSMGDNVVHALRVLFEDGCGNQVSEYIEFDVIDCKGPAPVCINGLTVTLMPQEEGGCAMAIWASDFEGSPISDCTGQGPELFGGLPVVNKYAIYRASTVEADPNFVPSPDDTGLVLTDADDDNTIVYVYAFDEDGNYDFCETYVLVQQHSDCGLTTGTAAGIILTEGDEPVEGVEVNVNGGESSMVTNTDGTFSFELPVNEDYTITPYLNADPLNGVSTFDLVLISKHVLGIEMLDSPYKIIAADANRSGSVTTLDMIKIRQVILNIESAFENNTSWRFIDADHVFTDPSNPWTEVFPELISVNNFTADLLDADFIGIKIGDVNGTAQANALTSDDRNLEGVFHLQAEDITMKAGNTYTVAITGENLSQIKGYQGTLELEGAELIDIEYGIAEAGNFGLPFIEQGYLTMSWNCRDALQCVPTTSNPVLFSLVIRATDNQMLSEALSINDRYTVSEAYSAPSVLADISLTEGEEVQALGLEFTKSLATGPVFELYQNSPNPFREGTLISFNLPEDSKATLTISDASGQVLQIVRGEYAAGYNTINVTKSHLQGASGVLSYTIQTSEYTATRQMIVVE
ncbi:MAG: T9SS type A sorting domain-containing protein, partial [Bacteroidota bacterium]